MPQSFLQSLLTYSLSFFYLISPKILDTPAAVVKEPSNFFNWSSIGPNPSLTWVNCYERQECARLEVPFDWQDNSVNGTVTLALIREPVNISRTEPSYGGSILINPGGPGGSGLDIVRFKGHEIQSNIRGSKQFDVVSWDPRGVGETTPTPKCFFAEIQRQIFWNDQDVVGLVDESEYALQYNWIAAKAFGRNCNSTVMRYMTTYANVQDILAIADALEPDVKEPLINYWGISYGTVIGNTLASTFPHRIGKIVLDGIVGPDDYLSGAWQNCLVDIERVLTYFYTLCHQVGPNKCPIYESTPDLIRHKIDSLLSDILIAPIQGYNSAVQYAYILISSQLRGMIFSALYSPPLSFSFLARALHSLLQSPPETVPELVSILHAKAPILHPHPGIADLAQSPYRNPPSDSHRSPLRDFHDAERIIACTDAISISNWTIDDFRTFIHNLTELSPLTTGVWAQTTVSCTGWPETKRAPEHLRFSGPFGSNLSSYALDRGARPILFIGNEADPVTPFVFAREQSQKHEGSALLKTDMYGHATVPGMKSECVWGVLREYWNDGTLPEKGTLCKGDNWEW